MFDATPLRAPARHAPLGLHLLSPPPAGLDYNVLPDTPEDLWSDLTRPGPLIVQIRHRYARLITTTPLPDWSEIRAETGPLTFRSQTWGAVALRRCACLRCQCPPSVRIHDQRGGEALQLCAPPGLDRARWRSLYRHFTPSPAPGPWFDDTGGVLLPQLPPATGPRLEPDALPGFLALLAAQGESVLVTLHTPVATLTRRIAPERIFAESHVLTLGDGVSTLQVALPGFFALAPIVSELDAAPLVHLVGPGDTSLLTLAPTAGRPAAFRWRDLLGRFHS
jgi:hypothetical protein